MGKPVDRESAESGTKLSRGANFRCLMSGEPITPEYVTSEAISGRMGVRLMAVVAEGERGRIYLSPTPEFEAIATQAQPNWQPDVSMPNNPRWFSPPLYGLTTYGDLFTSRQLVTLTTLSDLLHEIHPLIVGDAIAAGMIPEADSDDCEVTTATSYADAVVMYLAMSISRWTDLSNSVCSWNNTNENVRALFSRQAVPMTWDFVELFPFSKVGSWFSMVETLIEASNSLPSRPAGHAYQVDAASQTISEGKVVSTDPPYYDNIGYADLSDFFYVWLRRSLRRVFPELFSTVAVPKAEELVATPYRHGNKEKAESFFLNGMTHAMHRVAEQTHPAFPVTIYYAFKQTETEKGDTASTGWETFLDALIRAGFGLTGTWPMRTEREARSVGLRTNALASSIILVCRPRSIDSQTATRRELLALLRSELPNALLHLQRANIAPVDLAQAAIGPGMAVYTRFAKVLDAEGKTVSVREALALINQTLDEVLAEQEGDFDNDSRWALAWFEQFGFGEGDYGRAETLSTAKNTSVFSMVQLGIVAAKGGKVRLLRPSELSLNWEPGVHPNPSAWEYVHHLVKTLESGGEIAAAGLVAKMRSEAELARELAYRLYSTSERKKRAQEALSYNSLVQSWPEISRLASELGREVQAEMFSQE
jgi:putative DNA methylase